MDGTRKVKTGTGIAVLVLSLSFAPCQASQKDSKSKSPNSSQMQESTMSTAEIVQRMRFLNEEITKMMDKMQESASGKGSQGPEDVTFSRDQMLFMCGNMKHLTDDLANLISELDKMASNKTPITKESFKGYAERMLKSMDSCVKHTEALWEGQGMSE
jgi:hypothetical protein